mgnify:CR=1 FL=1
MERILTSYKLLSSGDYSHQKTFTFEDKSVMNFIDEESDSSGCASETDDETVPLLKPNMEPANVLDDGPIEMMKPANVLDDGPIEMMKPANVLDDGPIEMMNPAIVLDDGPIEMMDMCPEDMIEKPIIPVHVEQHCDNHCAVTSDVIKS